LAGAAVRAPGAYALRRPADKREQAPLAASLPVAPFVRTIALLPRHKGRDPIVAQSALMKQSWYLVSEIHSIRFR